MKECANCKNVLKFDQFKIFTNKKKNTSYKSNICIECIKKRDRLIKKQEYLEKRDEIIARNKNYYLSHKENYKIKRRQRYLENKDQIIKDVKEYSDDNKEKIKLYQKEYRDKNKEKLNKSRIERKKSQLQKDPSLKLRRNIRTSINNALNKIGKSKNNLSCFKYLNYSFQELKEYIENYFKLPENYWMNWNNRGIYNSSTWNDNDSLTWTWQIDHIIPQSEFIYNSMEHPNFKKCWALNNLRPLSSKLNNIKGNRLNSGI